MIARAKILLSTAIVLFAHGTASADPAGFVREGAFVISREPNAVINGVPTRTKLGYLPVGSVVFVRNCFPVREGASQRGMIAPRERDYCDVTSEVGINGLVRKDLIQVIEERWVAIAIGDSEVLIRRKDLATKLSSFSRTSGVFVEVIGRENPEFYRVRLPWSEGQEGFIEAADQERNLIRLLDGNSLDVAPVEFRSVRDYTTDHLPTSYIAQKLDETVDRIAEELDVVENLECLVDLSIVGETGVRIFGNGLGLKGAVEFFSKGFMYDTDVDLMFRGRSPLLTFVTVKKLKCENNPLPHPATMTSLSLFVDRPPKEGNRVLWLKGTEGGEDGAHIVVDVNDAPPMIKISNWYDYQRELTTLRRNVPGNVFLRSLEPSDREAVLHYMLSKAAFFYPTTYDEFYGDS